MPSRESSHETPRMLNPVVPKSFCSAFNSGTSVRQGTHHVAQKFKRTTCPRKLCKATFFPLRVASSISGAVKDTSLLAVELVSVALTLIRDSKFGRTDANRVLASRVAYPVAMVQPMRTSITPDAISTL